MPNMITLSSITWLKIFKNDNNHCLVKCVLSASESVNWNIKSYMEKN